MAASLRRIYFAILSEPELFDIAGPESVFRSATRCLRRLGVPVEHYCVDLLSASGGLVGARQDIRVNTSPMRDLAPGECDTIFVVGGRDLDDADQQAIAWLQRNHLKVRRLSSVGVGAFALAAAGLLDGRRAATNWFASAALQAEYPAIQVDRVSNFVEDRGVWTCAGMTAGVDMALAMVAADHGRALAQLVACAPAVVQEEIGDRPASEGADNRSLEGGKIPALLRWIAEHPGEDLRTERLAEHANMSLRNFYRAFENATGEAPAQWVKNVRLEVAKHLLKRTSRRIEQVAWEAGFASHQRMNRAFFQSVGLAPGEYRERYSPPQLRSARIDPAQFAESTNLASSENGNCLTPNMQKAENQAPQILVGGATTGI